MLKAVAEESGEGVLPKGARTLLSASAGEGESRTGNPPVASAEKTGEEEPASVAEKPVEPPAESIGKTPTPAVATSDQEPAPEPKEAPAALPLQPDLAKRLSAYVAVRRDRLDALAGQYLRGLETRLDQAANAGNLPLATAFREEKARVEALRGTMAKPPEDVAEAERLWPKLPALAEDAPEELAGLREVWEGERGKIREELDGKLAQSLQALEGELTRERRFEEAQSVLAYREALQEWSAGTPARNESGDTETLPDPGSEADRSVRAPATDNPRFATKKQPFENSLGMKFVPVPGTEVLFCIHETRWKDYEVYAAENPGINSHGKTRPSAASRLPSGLGSIL